MYKCTFKKKFNYYKQFCTSRSVYNVGMYGLSRGQGETPDKNNEPMNGYRGITIHQRELNE